MRAAKGVEIQARLGLGCGRCNKKKQTKKLVLTELLNCALYIGLCYFVNKQSKLYSKEDIIRGKYLKCTYLMLILNLFY